jgi:hypothetical protein
LFATDAKLPACSDAAGDIGQGAIFLGFYSRNLQPRNSGVTMTLIVNKNMTFVEKSYSPYWSHHRKAAQLLLSSTD